MAVMSAVRSAAMSGVMSVLISGGVECGEKWCVKWWAMGDEKRMGVGREVERCGSCCEMLDEMGI